ncbi:MAG: NAD(P)/FAD-dependent oxidoreductase [Candidatus Obscuribacterales bacterium]|nr:NAD(P)/FAD-dependent oxidoreductase [Candidatus Obscuribacterales bacterium]
MKVGIIGAGHNGLVCAFYLAKQGHKVSIFEKRSEVGGLCLSEELFPGFKVSTVASYFGMLRSEVSNDMELEKFGLETYLTDPIEVVMLPNNHFVFTPREEGSPAMAVGTLSESELAGWKAFWSDLGKAATLIYPLYFQPQTTQNQVVEILNTAGLDKVAKNIFSGSLFDLLHEYVQNPSLLAAAATCTPGFANKKGSVFGCIHHGTAKTKDEFGAWGFVKGGMGEITQAMKRSCQAQGVQIFTEKSINKVLLNDNKASGLQFADGQEESFDLVVSNTDPFTLFQKLLPEKEQPTIEQPTVSAGKVHFALSALPPFTLLDQIKHNYKGVIVSAPSIDHVIADSELVPQGKMPQGIMLTMCFPSTADETAAPAGKQLLTVDIHYLPATLEGQPWNEKNKQVILDAVLTRLKELSPDFESYVLASHVVSPGDIENMFSVRHAACWHLPMTADYTFEKRLAYATSYENLYLCGASTYPGGNVTGANGFNCAQTIVKQTSGKLPTAGARQ